MVAISKAKKAQVLGVLLEELALAVSAAWGIVKERDDPRISYDIAAPGEPVGVTLVFYGGEGHVTFRIGNATYRRGSQIAHRITLVMRGEAEIRRRLRSLCEGMAAWRAAERGELTDLQQRECRALALAETVTGAMMHTNDSGTPTATVFMADGRMQTFSYIRREDGCVRIELYATDDEARRVAAIFKGE